MHPSLAREAHRLAEPSERGGMRLSVMRGETIRQAEAHGTTLAVNCGSAPEKGKSPHAAGDLSKGVKHILVTARWKTSAPGAWRHAARFERSNIASKALNQRAPTRPAPDFEGAPIAKHQAMTHARSKFLPIPDYSSCIQCIPANDWCS